MLVNAQEICRVRTCIAAECGNDPEPSGYCARCERLRRRGVEVRLHRVIQPKAPNHDAELWCTGCVQWKPDAEYPLRNDAAYAHRRYRRNECLACDARRRKRNRINQTPEQRALELAKGRERNAKRRARLRAERGTP